ncbi:MAG TPA: patatin-like phospholipase family protein [Methylomirabilota bacterium]|nr:patatin-like phospholipase family protein [Methylomirabilota bacterium]
MRALIAIVLAAAVLSGCASRPERQARKMDEMLAARRASDAVRADQGRELIQALMARAESKAAAAKATPTGLPPTIDILVISGGGDWGAFGAGVLKGWGRVNGEMARPRFDVVTGVSTGAMIAPFAFLGDNDSIERIVQLYRNPQPDWTKSQGLVFFWPSNPSFYALPGLQREMKKTLDKTMLERIAGQDGSGRALIVNTTNVDFGDMHAWNIVAEAKTALAKNDDEWVHRILLASAGIPGIFPAQGLGESLYVDGAVTGNILYGGRTREQDSLPALWRAKYPNEPMPRMRYWVIFNNQFRFPPQVTQERWPDVMGRATIMSTQTSTMNSMRHLYAQAELAHLKHKADIEVRVMAVPDEWIPPSPGNFQKDVMNSLADLGEKMGADPGSWRTDPP